jgi:hypothetical protein
VEPSEKPKPRRKDLRLEATIPKEFLSQGGEFREGSWIGSIIEDTIPKFPNGFTHCIPNQSENLSALTLGIFADPRRLSP